MAQKELVYKVKVKNEAGEVVTALAKDINTLNKSVKDLEGELDKTELGSDKWKDLQKELKNSKGALDEAKSAGQSFSEKLSSIPGPIGSVVQGVKGLGTAFKALAANPLLLALTAIVGVLTALYKAFASTKEGGEKLQQLSAGLGAAMDVLRDILVKVANVLINIFSNPIESLKKFGQLLVQNIINRFEGMLELIPAIGKAVGLLFKGEFAEAGKVAADAVGKVVLGVEDVTDKIGQAGEAVKGYFNEALTEGKKAASLAKELQAIADAQRELNNRRAEQNKLIADAKLKINDENLSYEERLGALEEVRKAEVALAEQESALAARRYKAIQAQNALSDSSAEALDQEAAAYQAMMNAQLASSQKQKELFDQEVAIRAKQKGELKAVADLERTLRTASEEDELKRKEAELQAQMEADIASIEMLKTTEEKKAELRLLAQQKYDTSLELYKEEQAQKELDAEMKRVDSLLELDKLKYETSQEYSQQDIETTIDLMKEKTRLMLENEKLTAEERELIEKTLANNILKLRTDLEEKTQALYDAQAQAAANALGSVAQAAGESTALGKVAGVAQATINTYLAASNAFKEATKAGGPLAVPLGVAAAGAAIALGLKQVNEIMSVNTNVPTPTKKALGGIIQGQGSGSMDNIPALLSPGESVINARSTRMFGPTLDLINQLGGGAKFAGGMVSNGVDSAQMELISGIRGYSQRPVQAYVVASQANNQLQLDRQIKSRSLV